MLNKLNNHYHTLIFIHMPHILIFQITRDAEDKRTLANVHGKSRQDWRDD